MISINQRDKFFSCTQIVYDGSFILNKLCDFMSTCVRLDANAWNDDNNNNACSIKKNHKSTLKITAKKYVGVFFCVRFILFLGSDIDK